MVQVALALDDTVAVKPARLSARMWAPAPGPAPRRVAESKTHGQRLMKAHRMIKEGEWLAHQRAQSGVFWRAVKISDWPKPAAAHYALALLSMWLRCRSVTSQDKCGSLIAINPLSLHNGPSSRPN